MNSVCEIWILLLLTLALQAGALAGESRQQSLAEIVDASKAHLLRTTSQLPGKASIEITPLDHRLHLVQCDRPLETFSPAGASRQGRTTVGVRCSHPKPWTLYVSAHIALQGPVVVAVRDLSRGVAIGRRDIELVVQDTSHLLRGHFDDLKQVIGRSLKRRLRRGQVVTPSLLKVQKTIQRGQKVTILAGGGAIQVRMRGKALGHGNPGELIQVQNLASKKRIEARVVSAGLVRVDY